MDIESIKVWLQAVNMLGTFGVGVWLYLEKRGDKTNERVGEIAKQVDSLDKDVASLKAASDKAPSHQDLAKVYEAINELAEKVDKMIGSSESQTMTLRQILNRVIERGMP